MKIEIKGLKHSEFASHDSSCFEANVYVDGKKVGRAYNDGWGGPTMIIPDSLGDRIDAWLKTIPPRNDGLTWNAEFYVSELVEQQLRERQIQKQVKKIQKQIEAHQIVILTGQGDLVLSSKVGPQVVATMVTAFTKKPEAMRAWARVPEPVSLKLLNPLSKSDLLEALRSI